MYSVKKLFLAEEYNETKSGLSLQNDYDDDLSVVSGGFLVSCSFSMFFFVL